MVLYVENFADLMNGHLYAEIVCPIQGKVVRRLAVSADGDSVTIDALVPPLITIPIRTPITFVPWHDDRGNLVFSYGDLRDNTGKICTQGDLIRFSDGKEYVIQPLHEHVS